MGNQLIVIPSVPVWIEGDKLVFDRKFYDGMLMYIHLWCGSIKCLLNVAREPLPAFGVVRISRSELSFEVVTIPSTRIINDKDLKGGRVVLASADAHDQLHLSHLCRELAIKCVYVIENIVETRYQIIKLATPNFFKRLRRYLFIWNTERKRRLAFGLADGLQANGVAAYKEYQSLCGSILYFDTRVHESMIIKPAQLTERFKRSRSNGRLNLAYSGRLINIKGADQLIELAERLRAMKVEFHLSIYGAGELFQQMSDQIKDRSLAGLVTLFGALDFKNELIPTIQKNIDVYVLPHRQSDPSCTYLETLSCGIPIVGYNNKSFHGLLEESDIGWACELDDIEGIANLIEELASNIKQVQQKSKRAMQFARQHDFERTYTSRIEQLNKLTRS